MRALIIVNSPKDWPFELPDVDVVSARRYLTDATYSELRGVHVFNLCKSYRYQSLGYYVSLLATARGHKPTPSLSAIQDLKAIEIVRIRSDEFDDLVQSSLKSLTSTEFVLSIYFGQNLAVRYERLSAHLFRTFGAPLLRATFHIDADQHWNLQKIGPIAADQIPEAHRDFVLTAARDYFSIKRHHVPKSRATRYDLAILYDPSATDGPSDEAAIKKFCRAANQLGMDATLVDRSDYASIAEFDALFIRETTNVNHHTYRFARRAQAEGLVVVDDPDSILRCTNKVFLNELLSRHRIPTPKTVVLHRDNVHLIATELGFPCILKQPDSAFSQGVIKVQSETELLEQADRMFNKSELIIAQSYLPTSFDWRIGIFDRKPIWAAKYHMAQGHWQIIKQGMAGRRYGRVEAVPLSEAPQVVVKTALRSANLIGDGLYGVDVKEVGRRAYIVEVNDNPSIDSGFEDGVLKAELYRSVMQVFFDRLEHRFARHGVRR
ncbi:MAG: RimK family protein [Polyangiaceae bacterium]|nr:RimK family protein [Polyangiaceae bacterium]